MVQIIHAGAAEMSVRYRKPGRLDDVSGHIKARAETENRSGVLRNVGLEEGYAHLNRTPFSERPSGQKVTVAERFVICQWCIAIVGLRCLGKGVNRTVLGCLVSASLRGNGGTSYPPHGTAAPASS